MRAADFLRAAVHERNPPDPELDGFAHVADADLQFRKVIEHAARHQPHAVAPYKNKAASPDEVARSLGVRYQVEGSVLRTGDRLRVSAQLVNSEGQVLWSARFDEAIADLFALQDKITTQVSGVLATRVA